MFLNYDMDQLYNQKKDTVTPFESVVKKYAPVKRPDQLPYNQFVNEIEQERQQCFKKTSLQRVRHVFNKQIHPISIKKQCPELEQFVYDYSFGIKKDSSEKDVRIWTLSHSISSLLNVNKSDEEIVIVSGKLIQPDYAFYGIKDKHKSDQFDVIDMEKLSSDVPADAQREGDVLLNRCMIRLARVIGSDRCCERIIDGELSFLYENVPAERLECLTSMDARYRSDTMSLRDKFSLPIYKGMNVKNTCITLAITATLVIALFIVILAF